MTGRRFLQLLARNQAIAAIMVATAVSMTGQGVITPVLPLFAREFNAGATSIGLVVGVFGLARLFLNVPAGLIAQRFGRKLLMSGGLLVTAVGTGLMGISHSIPQLILWRFLAGAGSALFITGAMAYIADMSTPQNRGRLMSLQQGSLLLGVDIGPAIGGVVADLFGFRWPFYLAGMLAAASALWTLLRLPEVKAPPRQVPSVARLPQEPRGESSWDVPTIKTLLKNPTFLLVSLFTLIVFFSRTGARQSILPLVSTDRLGMSATELGLLFTAMTTINFLFILPAGALTDRFGRKAVIMPGVLLSALGFAIFALGNSLWLFFGAAVILGLGTGVIGPAPAAYAGDLAPPGKAGVTMGLYRTFGDVGFVIGPVILGWVADATSFGGALLFNAALMLGLALALVIAAKETAGRRGPSTAPVASRQEESS